VTTEKLERDDVDADAVIDNERDSRAPVPHHVVSGHFEGRDGRFAFYFPRRSDWEGRFFQCVYPLQDEHAPDERIAFAAASGAYAVQATGELGFQVAAAAARFSRTVAARYYDAQSHIFGYVYGGSGGSLQTIGAIEHTTGAWDGAVPFVNAVPTSIPSNFTIRALAAFVLRAKAQQLADCVRPGGADACLDESLDETERAVLHEATCLGIPLRAWENFEYVATSGRNGVLGFLGQVRRLDPTYATDFWNAPGYLGTEQSALGDRFRAAKVDHVVTVTRVEHDASNRPATLALDQVPDNASEPGAEYTLTTANGASRVTGALDVAAKTFTVEGVDDAAVVAAVKTGDTLRMDKEWYLAMLTYHRHQVPADVSFSVWDQYRDGERGMPPQRDVEVAPIIASAVTGGPAFSGAINAKAILVDNLVDCDAFPWHGPWYADRVRAALGERFDDMFRLWFNDNADHLDAPVTGERAAFLVPYVPMLEQALRDVSAWVERGVAPPASTVYTVDDGQIQLPATAGERRGIQPVVALTVNGRERVEVERGERVVLEAHVDVPNDAGTIVAAEWDFVGTGDFPYGAGPVDGSAAHLTLTTTHSFAEPGTYFPMLRVTSHRTGQTDTPFAGVQNLGRVRVVVNG
jgi:hypothetical protein